MDEWIRLAKALSDENRVRALLLLRDGELCACHILETLGLAPSTVSAHMAILQRAGLVDVRKEGRWRHYRLAGKSAPPAVRKCLGLMRELLKGEPRAAADRRRLASRLAAAGCTG